MRVRPRGCFGVPCIVCSFADAATRRALQTDQRRHYRRLRFVTSTASTALTDQLPKNTLQYEAGPLHAAGAAAWAAPEAAANRATEAIRTERMRFIVLLLFSDGSRSGAIDGLKNIDSISADKQRRQEDIFLNNETIQTDFRAGFGATSRSAPMQLGHAADAEGAV